MSRGSGSSPLSRAVTAAIERVVAPKIMEDELTQIEQAEKELQEARAKAMARAAASDDGDSGSATQDPTREAINEMAEEVDCAICQRVLGQIQGYPEPKRSRALADYGAFRKAVDESEDAAVEVLDDSELLQEAITAVKGIE